MPLSIHSLMADEGPAVHYDPKFCRTMETYMDYLRKHPDTQVIGIDPHDAYKYEGDISGLLRNYDIPRHIHWVVLRMNQLTDSSRVDLSVQQLLVPDNDVVNAIRQLYLTTNKKRRQ